MSAELGTLSRSEAELTDANLHLKAKVDGVREELRGARAQAERSQHEAERYIKRYLDTPPPPHWNATKTHLTKKKMCI